MMNEENEDGECVSECPDTAYLDHNGENCIRCDATCITCTGPGDLTCTSCPEDRYLVDN